MDPSNKCQKLKVKAHSGGLVTKQGDYKTEYQQHDPNGCLVRTLDDLYDAARFAQTELESFLRHLVGEVNGLNEESLILPKLKPRDRAFEKAKTKYHRRSPGPPESWLYDIVRAGIVCKTIKQLKDVNNWLGTNGHLVQVKNRFLEPVFNGYRDLLYHVSIPFRDAIAHICEIQVHHENIYATNDQYGTIKHYDFFRSCFANPWRSQEDTMSDLSMMNTCGQIAGPLMKKLLKSSDSEQLRFFAGIFRDQVHEYDRSLQLYRRVLNLQEDSLGSEHQEMAATYFSIGLVLGAMGDTDKSLVHLLKAMTIQESFLGMDHVDVADSYAEIGHMLTKRGDYSGAYIQYQRTLSIRKNKLGTENFLVINSLQDIGLVLQKKSDFKASETEYRKALGIQKEVLGEGHPDLATTHSLIGTTLCLYGDYAKAMVENKLALSIRENGLGKNHPTAAESHTAIGLILYHQGDYKLSRWHHTKALRIRQSTLGKDDVECAASHSALGELLSRHGDYEGAVSKLKRAQEILKVNFGMDHPVTAGSYLDIGRIHCRHGNYDEALAQYRRAKVVRESILGQDHPDTALTYMCVGQALGKKGSENHQAAVGMHKKALIVFESVLGDMHPITATGYQSRGDAYAANGLFDAALKEHRKALKIRKANLLKDHPDIVDSFVRIGKVLLLSDKNKNPCYDPNEALKNFRQVLTSIVARCGNDHPESATARFDVARALLALADEDDADSEVFWNEAEHLLRDALSVLRKGDPFDGGSNSNDGSKDISDAEVIQNNAIVGRACVALGTLLKKKGNDKNEEEARDMYTEGLECLTTVMGADHPEILDAKQKLLSLPS